MQTTYAPTHLTSNDKNKSSHRPTFTYPFLSTYTLSFPSPESPTNSTPFPSTHKTTHPTSVDTYWSAVHAPHSSGLFTHFATLGTTFRAAKRPAYHRTYLCW